MSALFLLSAPTNNDFAKNAVESIGFSSWLLWQGSLEYKLLLPPALVLLWCACDPKVRGKRWMIFVQPAFWLLPLVLSGVFDDHTSSEAKTADWIGYFALVSFALQVLWSFYAIVRLAERRSLAVISLIANAGIGAFSLFIVGMASTGDWI